VGAPPMSPFAAFLSAPACPFSRVGLGNDRRDFFQEREIDYVAGVATEGAQRQKSTRSRFRHGSDYRTQHLLSRFFAGVLSGLPLPLLPLVVEFGGFQRNLGVW